MDLNNEDLILDENYRDLAIKNTEGIIFNIVGAVLIIIMGSVFISVSKINNKIIGLFVFFAFCFYILAIFLIINFIYAIKLPNVLVKYNKDGLLVLNKKQEIFIKWDDIRSVDVKQSHNRWTTYNHGLININNEIKVYYVNSVVDIQTKIVLLKNKAKEFN